MPDGARRVTGRTPLDVCVICDDDDTGGVDVVDDDGGGGSEEDDDDEVGLENGSMCVGWGRRRRNDDVKRRLACVNRDSGAVSRDNAFEFYKKKKKKK